MASFIEEEISGELLLGHTNWASGYMHLYMRQSQNADPVASVITLGSKLYPLNLSPLPATLVDNGFRLRNGAVREGCVRG